DEGYRCRQYFVDGAGKARKVDAERSVRDALGQQHQHDQAGHDEGAVAHAVDLADPGTYGRAEDDEVERSRDDGRHDALEHGAAHARHLEGVDCADGVPVHAGLFTRLTNISSRELCVVCRSPKRTPTSFSSPNSAVMPVRSAWVS